MTLLTAILIFYAGLVTVSFIAVLIWASFAPYGREIPGIGFVEDDPDQDAYGDERFSAIFARAFPDNRFAEQLQGDD